MTSTHDRDVPPEPRTNSGDGPFDRFAIRVGDLDHPFYAEERDRDVWNEASAVGFQFLLWGLIVAATVATWVVGADARPYVLVATLLAGAASLLVMGYTHRRGVDGGAAEVLAASRGRVAAYSVLVVALAVGLVTDGGRSSVVSDLDAATAAGMVVGAGAVLGVAALAKLYARRRALAGDDPD